MRDLRDLHTYVNGAGLRFVMCELELGITFYALGQATNDERSTRRNTTNAIKAYASAMRYVKRLVLKSKGQGICKQCRWSSGRFQRLP